jgi:uncharacterized protein with HEPN domain
VIRDDQVYLSHIQDALQQISTYTEDMDFTKFSENRMTQDAVIRQFEIVGEAVKNLSEAFRESHLAMPWKDLASFRDKLIHQYFGVDLAMVWRSVIDDLPMLLEGVLRIQMSERSL